MGEGHPYHHSAVQNCYHHALPTISSKISTDSTIADPFEGFTLDDIEAAKARLGERWSLTTEQEISVFALLRLQTFLWDASQIDYRKTGEKDREWEKEAARLGVTGNYTDYHTID